MQTRLDIQSCTECKRYPPCSLIAPRDIFMERKLNIYLHGREILKTEIFRELSFKN